MEHGLPVGPRSSGPPSERDGVSRQRVPRPLSFTAGCCLQTLNSGVQSIEARTNRRRSHARSQARRGKHRPTAAHTGPSTATLHINGGRASRNHVTAQFCFAVRLPRRHLFFPCYSSPTQSGVRALPQSSYSMKRSLTAGSRERNS